MPVSPFFQGIYYDDGTKLQSIPSSLSTVKFPQDTKEPIIPSGITVKSALLLGSVRHIQHFLKDVCKAAELSIELQIERMHLTEAMSARDTLAQRLHDAYSSLSQKTQILDTLVSERDNLKRELQDFKLSQGHAASSDFSPNAASELLRLQNTVLSLSNELNSFKQYDNENQVSRAHIEPPSREAEQIPRPHSVRQSYTCMSPTKFKQEFGRPFDINASCLLNSQLAVPLSVPSRPTTSPPMSNSLASPYPSLICPDFGVGNIQGTSNGIISEECADIYYHVQ
jgi:hypothetical protein